MHLEGSLEPEMLLALAQRNGVRLPYPDVAALRRAYSFDSLQSFLDLYYLGLTVLQTGDDFYQMTEAYLARAVRENVRHAEVFISPQAHLRRGRTHHREHPRRLRCCPQCPWHYWRIDRGHSAAIR
jgi:adenosine deaminase